MEKVKLYLARQSKKKVLQNLNNPKTATRIAKEINTHRATASRVLLELEKEGFVVCLDTDKPYNRYYVRTKEGDNAIKEIEKLE